jgi:hypothetical protein
LLLQYTATFTGAATRAATTAAAIFLYNEWRLLHFSARDKYFLVVYNQLVSWNGLLLE